MHVLRLSLVITYFILITFTFDQVVIWLGEVIYLSLLVLSCGTVYCAVQGDSNF